MTGICVPARGGSVAEAALSALLLLGLAELAVADPPAFAKLAETAKAQIA